MNATVTGVGAFASARLANVSDSVRLVLICRSLGKRRIGQRCCCVFEASSDAREMPLRK